MLRFSVFFEKNKKQNDTWPPIGPKLGIFSSNPTVKVSLDLFCFFVKTGPKGIFLIILVI